MTPITLEAYHAQVERDKILITQGYPNYRPKTAEGRAYQQEVTPATHTGVYAQKPNPSIHIHS